MIKKIFILFFLFFPSTLVCVSQNREFKISGITDQYGRSPGATFSIVEDQLGFIWFGTLNGLMRYDGYGFKRFDNEQGKQSLTGKLIRAMHIDDDGIIWMATQGGGLKRFDTKHEQFVVYRHEEGNENSISGNDLWAIDEDQEGNLWIGTWSEGLNRFNKQSGSFTTYFFRTAENGLNEDAIRSILVDNEGYIWVGFNSTGVVKFDPESEDYTVYRHNPQDQRSIGSDAVYDIYQDRDNNIWFSSIGGGVSIYTPGDEGFTVFYPDAHERSGITGNSVYRTIRLNNGDYLLGYEGSGVDFFDPKTNTLTQISAYTESSLTSDRIRYLFEDSRGIIWVGSETGVDKITRYKNFRIYRHKPGNPNTINARIVRSIFQDHKQLIWMGSFNVPLTCYDRRKDQFIHNGKVQQVVGLNSVTSMVEDDKKRLWIGTTEGIFVFDADHNLVHRFVNDSANTNSISDNTIQLLRIAPDGKVWAGTENGLNVFDPASGNWRSFMHQSGVPGSLGSPQIQPNALVIEENGVVWAGTWGGGLNKYLPDEDAFKIYEHDPENPNSLSNNSVLAIHKSPDGLLWLGTFGGGLVKFNPLDESFTTYTEADGLANNIVFSILDDSKGNLWIATDKGLSQFDPTTGEFLNFDVSDGLPSDQFFWGASYKSAYGVLVFGTVDGVLSFYPDDIELNQQPPDIKITDFKKYNESVSTGLSVTYSNHIEVNPGEMNFQVEFAALDYTDPQKNQFAYKILDTDEQWIHLGNRNFISFTNMAPGNYELIVKGSNNDGFWNEDGILLTIVIHPRLWQTAWFRVGLVVLLIAGLVVYYKLRTTKIKKQKRALEGIVQDRTKELAMRNEELKTANAELRQQREELSSTLETLKQTQQQLIHSEKMASLGVLAAGVAHEINNPLNFIKGAIVAIEEYFNENGEERDHSIDTLLKIANEGVSRASGIITSLNHYSRRDEERHEPADVHVIINNCLTLLGEQIGERIGIVKAYANEPLWLMCNEGKLHQALLNVLSNAIQSIEGTGRITVSTFMEDKNLVVGVEDTGTGMGRDVLSRITDPFFTTKAPGKGTGLGLSITQNIINEHAGKLEFHSEPGIGTKVLIILPAAH